MRKIVLTANDFELFDTEIGSVEFEFFHKHKDAFKRMWIEQGRKFWIQFVMSYRQYAVDYGTIKEFPAKNEHFEDFVDQAFIVIHDNFVEGKFGSARSFITDIVLVAQNRHALQYLESKSYAKDPFYNKETRDVFRRLFGPPNEKSSYLKVYILFPIYMKYAGAVCICLKRWLDATDIPLQPAEPSLHSQETKPPNHTSSNGTQSPTDSIYEDMIYPSLPPKGSRIMEMEEEMDMMADKEDKAADKSDDKATDKAVDKACPDGDKATKAKEQKDSGSKVDMVKKDEKDKAENEMDVIMTKGVQAMTRNGGGDNLGRSTNDRSLSDSDEDYDLDLEMDELESMYSRDGPGRMRREMLRRRRMMEESRMEYFDGGDEDEFFRMYIHEVKDGNKKSPSFVRAWPRGADPRCTDPDNPLYDPSNTKLDWKDGLKLPNFARFVKYVRKNYKRGVKLNEEEKLYAERLKQLEDMKETQMEDNFTRTLTTRSSGVKTEAYTIKLEDHKHKEAQEEKKRKRRLRKRIKKGLPVTAADLAGVRESKGPVPALISKALATPNQEAIRKGTQCPHCYNPMVKSSKSGPSRCSNVQCSVPLKGLDGGFQLAPGLHSIQVDTDKQSFKLEKPTKTDPRKPYILDQKKSVPRHVDPQRVEKRKDMDAIAPPEIEPNSVKLTKKVDDRKGTVTVTIEKRDGKGNTTTETTIKPLDGEDKTDIWEEALNTLNPLGGPMAVMSPKMPKEITSRISKPKMIEAGPTDRRESSRGRRAGKNKTSSSSQTTETGGMAEPDKKQFREMYQEISSAIGDVSRYAQGEDDPKGSSFACSHDTRHEKARNRLRRKLGEKKSDRKHPDLPGLVRLGGNIEYPANERDAIMLTLAEMTKMNSKEKELFQEKLGRTKYFKDQDDPRDVFDSMNQFLMPEIKDTLKDEKSKTKKSKIREKEKLEMERKMKLKGLEKEEKTASSDKNVENKNDNATKLTNGSVDNKEATEKTTGAESIGVEDIERVVKYKDEVKRMKADLDFNTRRLSHLMDSPRHHDSPHKSREFQRQVHDANRELRTIEDKLRLLDRECMSQKDPELTENVHHASDQLKRVQAKVKKWEQDADFLSQRLSRYEDEQEEEEEEDEITDDMLFGELLKRVGLSTEEVKALKKSYIPEDKERIFPDTTYDTHPPGHPEVTEEIIEESLSRRLVDRDELLKHFEELMCEPQVIGEFRKRQTRNEKKAGKSKASLKSDDSDEDLKQTSDVLSQVQQNIAIREFIKTLREENYIDDEAMDMIDAKEKNNDGRTFNKRWDKKIKDGIPLAKPITFVEIVELLRDKHNFKDIDQILEVAPENERASIKRTIMQREADRKREKEEQEEAKRQVKQELLNARLEVEKEREQKRKAQAKQEEEKEFGDGYNTDDEAAFNKKLMDEARAYKEGTAMSKKDKSDTILRTSHKLSHPVGGRLEDNRSPEQKKRDAEKYTGRPSTAKRTKSPEKKANISSDNRKSVKKEKGTLSKTLKVCSGCDKTEPSPKTFKKCQKCKEDQIKNSRYYCGRECQGEDWRKRHKLEHKEKRLD